jgi:predicted sulfurtransferase
VYCSIGKRSESITQKLSKAGYGNVSNLYGGIFEWVNQGNGVVDVNNKQTNKIHAYGKFWGQWLHKGEKVYK